jgi:hypothetical protein
MFRIGVGLLLLAGSVSAFCTPYWIDWEGSDWPENQGWTRSWGNSHGQHQGGALRTLENGVLTYDSLDPTVYDYSYMRPGQMDPCAPNELFLCEWRLKVDVVNGNGDPTVALTSTDQWVIGFAYAADHITSLFEGLVTIPFVPGAWHDYQFVSSDMRTYNLYIDGDLAREGSFWNVGFYGPYIGWGDGGQSSGSFHHWDWFRFGVVTPEPCGFLLLIRTHNIGHF